jgi:hypothetical protein
LVNRKMALQILRHLYGSAFSIDLPIFGLFKTAPDVADRTDANLGRVMGPNSMFALSGDRHRARRKLAAYEAIKPSRRCPR